ncbi:chaperonin 10-like protein [Pisolithus croceorrhizus]|nr:chaperonin 10-like protein [Pisolithus croceorrhizus]
MDEQSTGSSEPNQLVAWTRSFVRTRTFASSSAACKNKAIVYRKHGNPSEVLSVLSFPDLPPPPPNTANIRFRLSPINPADINVIEGVYPAKPVPFDLLSQDAPVYVGGNEGLAEVVQVGDGVRQLKKGDWVVMTKPQIGTWISARNVNVQDVLRVPSDLEEAQAATITVNPPTAYNMLHDFVHLEKGDWVIQNGANSAVCESFCTNGWKTLNFVRYLKDLGATQVATAFKDQIKTVDWEDRSIRLGLNCISGQATTTDDAHLVSYGAMSREPLSGSDNLTCHGFWQSLVQERERLMENLVGLMRHGKLRCPEHEVLAIGGSEGDEEKISEVMKRLRDGRYGRKVLLKLQV